MSARELGSRTLQAALQRRDAFYYLIGLPPVAPKIQETDCIAKRLLFATQDIPAIVTNFRELLPRVAESVVHRAHQICKHEFDMLGYTAVDYGSQINWSRDGVHDRAAPAIPWYRLDLFDFARIGDPKVTWELNRHQHLVILSKAWWLTQDDRFVVEALNQWRDWLKQNPYPIGINWASSLEVAFRSMSWLWMRALIGEHPLFTGEIHRCMTQALALHGAHIRRYLSTYTSPNTHLLGEALGLMALALFCPEITASSDWRDLGWRIVQEQLRRQVHADGMHFEQSTYYHVYALDMFLHARILAEHNHLDVPSDYDETLTRMLDVLAALSVAGTPPRFGDDDGGRVFDGQRNRAEHMADPLSTGAVMFRRGDWKRICGSLREETLWLLGPTAVEEFERLPQQTISLPHAFPFSGIYRLRDGQSELVLDAGPHGTGRGGHGHADALSITWRVDGNELFCDPGTYVYPEAAGRNMLRSTAAHNTLEIDGKSQCDVAGPFAWEGIPRSSVDRYITHGDFGIVRACQNGYQRLSEPVVHTRSIVQSPAGFSLVRDVARGTGRHELRVSWHLGSGVDAQFGSNGSILLTRSGSVVASLLVAGDPEWAASSETGFVSPAYGSRKAATVLRFVHRGEMPVEIATLLLPTAINNDTKFRHDAAAGVEGNGIYEFHNGGQRTRFLFNDSGQEWAVGNWSGNAEFFLISDREDEVQHIFVTRVSQMSYRHRPILSNSGVLELLNWTAGVVASSPAEEPDAAITAAIEEAFGQTGRVGA